jgi:hypothetical protein
MASARVHEVIDDIACEYRQAKASGKRPIFQNTEASFTVIR